MEYKILRHTATGKRRDLILQLLLAQKVPLLLIDLHRITERTGGTRNDRDLRNRS